MSAGGKRRTPGKEALECIEEAVHLLRLSPPGALAAYYVGSLPFVLGLLYFATDMRFGATAASHCGESAFGIALLFLWMKCWHTVYARRLMDRIGESLPSRWSPRRVGGMVALQACIQPTGLFLLPVAALATLPLGWAVAYYQNVTILGDGREPLRETSRRSWRQASLWPRQNHVLLAVLFLFWIFVLLNLAIALPIVPVLLKSLFGIDTIASSGPWLILNTTFLAVTFGIAWLSVDPLVKAVYVKRCFYGESLHSGADLKEELHDVRQRIGKRALAAALLLLLLGTVAGPAGADGGSAAYPAPALSGGGLSPAQLDRSIGSVAGRPEFAWRTPREAVRSDGTSEPGPLTIFLTAVRDAVVKGIDTLMEWVGKILEWLRPRSSNSPVARREPGSILEIMTTLQGMLFVLLALASCMAAVWIVRKWTSRSPKGDESGSATGPGAVPDLEQDVVGADLLSRDGWVSLAQELIDRGELRLALRALYLASLAQLARMEMLVIASHKSNREYEREVRRKARANPDLLSAFSQNVSVFDRVWYGTHDVNRETVDRFRGNLGRIAACAGP